MPKIRIIAKWTAEYQKNIPKGFLVLKYDQRYRKNLGKIFQKLDEYQNKKYKKLQEKGEEFTEEDYIRDLDVNIEYHFRKRTLDQNALMWSLYEIESNEMNGGEKGHKEQMVTPMHLYLQDLDEYGEREIIKTKRKNLGYYTDQYRIIESVSTEGGSDCTLKQFMTQSIPDDEIITLRAIRGTSKYTTKEMAGRINMIFNRIAYNGVAVTNPGEIEKYWNDFQNYKNENKIVLNDMIMTQQEYKSLNPLCEGCGTYIVESGQLAHIRAIGMGGDRAKEPKKNYTSNWLHLCNDCHNGLWHQKGVDAFLKKNKHLTYKVRTALNREYQQIPEEDESIDQMVIETKDEKYVFCNGQEFVLYDENIHPDKNFRLISSINNEESFIMKIKEFVKEDEDLKNKACLFCEKELNIDPVAIDAKWIGIF